MFWKGYLNIQLSCQTHSQFYQELPLSGGFHTLSCYIAAIGKLWGNGGLKDLLIDSSVYAAGTVDHMLNGKEFNRATLGVSWLSAFFSVAKSLGDRPFNLLSYIIQLLIECLY
jgi:hypothetical protein